MARKPPRPSKPLGRAPRENAPTKPRPIPVRVSFSLYEPGNTYCLSVSTREEVRQFTDCFRKLTSMTWEEVRRQGGKGLNKVGLAYTPYDDAAIRIARPNTVSPELTIAGIRASEKMRIFGVAIDGVFHVIWFDRNHDIVKG